MLAKFDAFRSLLPARPGHTKLLRRFVSFTIYDYAADSTTLFYRALDPNTGRPTGNLKKLLPDVCGPIHLIEDPKLTDRNKVSPKLIVDGKEKK